MPNQICTVCIHERRAQIDEAIARGTPALRILAKQMGLSRSALYRHQQSHCQRPERQGGDLQAIDAEISKLLRRQTKATKAKDEKTLFAISRELRSWHLVRAKCRAVAPKVNPAERPAPDSSTGSHGDVSDLEVAKLVGEITHGFDSAEIERLKKLVDDSKG